MIQPNRNDYHDAMRVDLDSLNDDEQALIRELVIAYKTRCGMAASRWIEARALIVRAGESAKYLQITTG